MLRICYLVGEFAPREALRKALDDLQLTYVVTDDVLLITSTIEAEHKLTTKVYPVLDIVSAGQLRNGRMAPLDYNSLADLLRTGVSSAKWDDSGGPASMYPYPNCGAMVVSQTANGHADVQRMFDALRAARNQAASAGIVDR